MLRSWRATMTVHTRAETRWSEREKEKAINENTTVWMTRSEARKFEINLHHSPTWFIFDDKEKERRRVHKYVVAVSRTESTCLDQTCRNSFFAIGSPTQLKCHFEQQKWHRHRIMIHSLCTMSNELIVCNTGLILDQLWTNNNQNGSNVWNILCSVEMVRNDFICVRLCVLRTHFDTNEFIRAYNFSRCMRVICANKSRSIYVNEVILRTMRSQWNTYYAILDRWHCSWHVQMSTKKLKKELLREQRSPAHRHNTVRLCTSPFTIRLIHTACHVS